MVTALALQELRCYANGRTQAVRWWCCATLDSTRGRGEVLGQAGVAEACAYTLEGVSKNQKKVR